MFLKLINEMNKKYGLKRELLARPNRFYDLIRAWLIGREPWSCSRVGDSKLDNEQERLIKKSSKMQRALYEALELQRAA